MRVVLQLPLSAPLAELSLHHSPLLTDVHVVAGHLARLSVSSCKRLKSLRLRCTLAMIAMLSSYYASMAVCLLTRHAAAGTFVCRLLLVICV